MFYDEIGLFCLVLFMLSICSLLHNVCSVLISSFGLALLSHPFFQLSSCQVFVIVFISVVFIFFVSLSFPQLSRRQCKTLSLSASCLLGFSGRVLYATSALLFLQILVCLWDPCVVFILGLNLPLIAKFIILVNHTF